MKVRNYYYHPNHEKLSDVLLENIFKLNELNKPALGTLENLETLKKLYNYSMLCACSFLNKKLVAFCLLMNQSSEYSSPNFKYFKRKYNNFLYIDRIAIDTNYQRKGIGSLIYERFYELSIENNVPLCCEVNTFPLNKKSLDFHYKKGFKKIEELNYGNKKVVMLVINNN